MRTSKCKCYCDIVIVIVMDLWAGSWPKAMDKTKQVAPVVLSQSELLVSCFLGESELQGFYLFYGESGTLSNDNGIETFFL